MRSHEDKTRLALAGSLLALTLACLVAASPAGAAPKWYFDEELLVGSETTRNGTPTSQFTIPGLTIVCQPLPLEMTIENSGGAGLGEVTDLPMGTCYTDSPACAVEALEAEKLPWSAKLAEVSGKTYLVTEGVSFSLIFGGEECVLYETEVKITGSTGGLVDNEEETIFYSQATAEATKTALKGLGQKVEWNAALELKATGPHRGDALSAH